MLASDDGITTVVACKLSQKKKKKIKKIKSIFLEPEDLYRKRLVVMRLRQTDSQHSLGYGSRILFVERPLKLLDNLPERTRAYVRAFHALKPHMKNGRPHHQEISPLCIYMRITLLHHLRGLAHRVFEGQLADELRVIVDALPPRVARGGTGPQICSNDAWLSTTDPNIVVRVEFSEASTRQAVYAFTRLSIGHLEPLQYLLFCRMSHLKPTSVLEWKNNNITPIQPSRVD